ncbi:MAG: TetR/AcrR family transcriptional regulator [Rhodococcus sp. (in: high G+C Gram-positive bacteria)]|uniref:TetR/AcrR family transcriptional regulator n=1 Tax=Rhodococcus sp. TaxID=1831 RepID=UPI002ADB0081|nr:TetR/AcrR family transcriptional regulator [Rhodococcus sp. (in: high G+C Gram-positive bacteria)]
MTDQNRHGSREKVLIAACEMIGEDPASTLSVRAVATRAGVSMGSLRHHFPTQRALREAVLDTIYTVVAPDNEIIHDRTVPARDRLVACLRQILAPAVGDQARRAWLTFTDAFLAPEPTDDLRTAYTAMTTEGQRRVEHWLTVLVREGALTEGDNAVRAGMLNAILTGLSLERALPNDESVLHRETAILYAGVDAVLGLSAGTPP